ncbi:hypothetical protein [Mycolicibacterium sp. OfavD-34-C]|uniref:hypothetical protein n=1 Tax=Mycolicibacterium sp. OfavD-34-C TaxID=2917746 RepID=UPI001EF5BAE4|nr:hypothetical protein [Mycolicibacterium sp. OfavD-34-C]MCG7582192.1 hypothetical protein [Mycolicibacterium sp. OfavD-34-C]
MQRTRKLFATTMIAAAGAVSAAVALSASATAQPAPVPAPAPAPAVPGMDMLQQLVNPAAASSLIQTFANAISPASAATPATAPATAPGATASVTLPQPVNTLPAVATPATAPASPLAGITDQLGVPGSLASLLPADNPLGGLLPTGNTPAAVTPAAVAPAATAPAPTGPVGTTDPLGPMSPLSALP